MNNKLKITTTKKTLLWVLYLLQKKIQEKNWNLLDFRSDPETELDPDPLSRKRIRGSALKWSESETLKKILCFWKKEKFDLHTILFPSIGTAIIYFSNILCIFPPQKLNIFLAHIYICLPNFAMGYFYLNKSDEQGD